MSDLLILAVVVVATSFVATMGIARRLRTLEPLTEVERLRLQLDAELDELSPVELEDLLLSSRKLRARRDQTLSLGRQASLAQLQAR